MVQWAVNQKDLNSKMTELNNENQKRNIVEESSLGELVEMAIEFSDFIKSEVVEIHKVYGEQ